MDYETVRQWLRCKPFEPFRVIVKDGRNYEVRYPRMNLLAERYIKIGIPDLSGPKPMCDHTEYVNFKQIERIEPLSETTAQSTK
jgi:hypothetical protein